MTLAGSPYGIWYRLLLIVVAVSLGAFAHAAAPTESTAASPPAQSDDTQEQGASATNTSQGTGRQNLEAIFKAPPPGTTILSITLSAIEFAEPIAEFTAELLLAPKMSAAVVLGFGNIEPEGVMGVSFEPIFALNLGAQWRHYFVGRFEQGFHVGAELMYYFRDTGVIEMNGEPVYEVEASSVSIGPFVGFKQVFEIGLTLDAALGFGYVFAMGEITDAEGNKLGDATSEGIGLLLNINGGWTF